jgi:hypothetical protein
MIVRRAFAIAAAGVIAIYSNAVAAPQQTASGELLALQDGFVFLTNGQNYRTSSAMRILDAKGNAVDEVPPFNSEITLSFDADGRVAVIARAASMANGTALRGALVPITFVVRVPASTGLNDQIYLTNNERNWDPLAIRMDRIDTLHFRAIISVGEGATLHYLYTRGNSQTIERGADGLQRKPRAITITNRSAQTIDDSVVHWGDEIGNGVLVAPQATPTPYNPAPYPNLPGAPSR